MLVAIKTLLIKRMEIYRENPDQLFITLTLNGTAYGVHSFCEVKTHNVCHDLFH